jgi:hypothetical protein
VTVYAGTDVLTGKMRQLRETAPTYAEANKILTKLQRQVDEDRHPKSDITVRQAIEQWLGVVDLEQTTRERYDDLIRLYILPTFGHLPEREGLRHRRAGVPRLRRGESCRAGGYAGLAASSGCRGSSAGMRSFRGSA